LATKVVAAIIPGQGSKPNPLRRWFSEGTDVRNDSAIGDQVIALLTEHGARSVVVAPRHYRCPHEEGIGYPDGESCPQCRYWAARDRWTDASVH